MSLNEIIPEGDYRFRMGIERENPERFFAPSPQNNLLLSERSHWLKTFPGRHAALLPEGEQVLKETIRFARKSGAESQELELHAESAWLQLVALGCVWEPDFLLLRTQADGSFKLAGGCVCFPSSWSLEEKIGQSVEAIHGIVPNLNSTLGAQIQAFLTKLRPGTTWLRTNWGLSRSNELNQHPARGLARMDNEISPAAVWLRVEHQAFLSLPETGGILFGIRIAMHPLNVIQQDARLSARLALAIRTMPAAVAQYKGLASAREKLLSYLER